MRRREAAAAAAQPRPHVVTRLPANPHMTRDEAKAKEAQAQLQARRERAAVTIESAHRAKGARREVARLRLEALRARKEHEQHRGGWGGFFGQFSA